MIEKAKAHFTQIVFWTAVALSVVSVALVAALGPALLVAVGASVLFNLWSVFRSERGGFVREREYRRAYEPARRFNALQVFVVFGLVMVQCGAGAYVLLSQP